MKSQAELSVNGQAAIALANRGFSVFPLAPFTKMPLAGSNGEDDGTKDVETITSWWRGIPDAGIGCALRYTPYFVVDVDARNGGHVWWDQVTGLEGAPTGLISETGSGWPSAHYWFRMSERLQNFRGSKIPGVTGIDLKGLPYGYVVVPPTVGNKLTKRAYSWWDGCSPESVTPPLPPRWLEDLILMGARRLPVHALSPLNMGLTFPRAIQHIAEGYAVGEQIGEGKWIAECPNASAHTSGGRRKDSSTILLAPNRPGGFGRIYCSHAHCERIK